MVASGAYFTRVPINLGKTAWPLSSVNVNLFVGKGESRPRGSFSRVIGPSPALVKCEIKFDPWSDLGREGGPPWDVSSLLFFRGSFNSSSNIPVRVVDKSASTF